MAARTFNFSAAQEARIDAARLEHFTITGQNLNVRQFLYHVCMRPAIENLLQQKKAREAEEAERTAIAIDMEPMP